MDGEAGAQSFSGRQFGAEELAQIREIVESCSGLSRMELAYTVCELLDWKRANGSLKGRECREFLERLESRGRLSLPEKRRRRPKGSRTGVPVTERGEPASPLAGTVRDFGPVVLERVDELEQRELFRELVGRYHGLGHKVPFGAHLRYLVWISRPERRVVGCLQFSSPAWRMAARDEWIGWDEKARKRNLQRVVNNSRFLVLPWVRVRNLASTVLSLGVRQMVTDWRERYEVSPLLVETLVNPERYRGSCYRAANWIYLGETTGRGRMDREHVRHGASVKTVWVYPLVRDTTRRLREN